MSLRDFIFFILSSYFLETIKQLSTFFKGLIITSSCISLIGEESIIKSISCSFSFFNKLFDELLIMVIYKFG